MKVYGFLDYFSSVGIKRYGIELTKRSATKLFLCNAPLRARVTFLLRLWLLYSLLILPFFSKLMLPSLLAAIALNLIGVKLHTKELRLGYLLEQLFKAVGEHRNFFRCIFYRRPHNYNVEM